MFDKKTFRFLLSVVAAGAVGLALPALAQAQGPNGALVRVAPGQLTAYLARHRAHAVQLAPNLNLYWVQANDGRSDSQLLSELQSDAATQTAELNAEVSEVGCDQSGVSVLNEESNDQDDQSGVSVLNQSAVSVLNSGHVNYYGSLVRQGYLNQPAVGQIRATGASAVSSGKGVVVAVIDDGVDPSSSVLAGVLLSGYNFFDNTSNWSCYADLQESDDDQSGVSVLNSADDDDDDQSGVSVLNDVSMESYDDSNDDQSGVSVLNDAGYNSNSTLEIEGGADVTTGDATLYAALQLNPELGHGTMVAGLIHLVAPQAQILPIKAFGPTGTATLANIVASIYYAVNQGANVINMSFSSTSYSNELSQAIAAATRARVVLVAAAGNSATSAAGYYPAAYPQVLGVAALNPDNTLAAFSNYGQGVSLAAPGVCLISTFPDNQWAVGNGTSFSAPLVAGEAAAVLAGDGYGSMTVSELFMTLTSNSNIPADRKFAVGAGIIQVLPALRFPF